MVRFTITDVHLMHSLLIFISLSLVMFWGALAAQCYEYSIVCYIGVDTYQVQAKMRPTTLPT